VPAHIEPLEQPSERRPPMLDRVVPLAAVTALIVMAALFVFFTVWAILLLA
jgi:hypothetical protein